MSYFEQVKTLGFGAVIVGALFTSAPDATAFPRTFSDFGLLLPAVSIKEGDGSVTRANLAEQDFHFQVLGDGSVRGELLEAAIIAIGDGSVRIDRLTFDMLDDPFIIFSVGATAFSSASVEFLFTFTTPYVAGPYDTMTVTDASATITDAGTGIIDLTPGTFANHIVEGMLDGALAGIGTGDGCAFDTTGEPGQTGTCDFPDASGAVSAAVTGNFSALVNFILTPDGDQAGVVGRVTLVNAAAVAEPTTLGLVLLGPTALAWRRRIAS
jgi:hypothetical protein